MHAMSNNEIHVNECIHQPLPPTPLNAVHMFLLLKILIFFLSPHFQLDNVPEEEPEVDRDALQGENPTLRLTWSPLSAEDGADFLVNYVVTLTIMELPQIPVVSRKRQAEQEESNTVERIIDKSQTSFESPVEPHTMYTSQVFSQLNVNGDTVRRAITSPINVASPESGNIDNDTVETGNRSY